MLTLWKKPANRRLSIYIPDRDRHGKPVPRADNWIAEACEVMATVCGGCTKLPIVDGFWQNLEGRLIKERSTIIYAYVDPARLNKNLYLLADFIHRFGIETNQESIALEYDGAMHFLDDFNKHALKVVN